MKIDPRYVWSPDQVEIVEQLAKHGDHDQEDHGNWARGYSHTPAGETKLRAAFLHTGDIRDDSDIGDDDRHERAARDAGIAEPVMEFDTSHHTTLANYKREDQPGVNQWLRGDWGDAHDESREEMEELMGVPADEHYGREARIIGDAIAKQLPLAKPLVVFRGMDNVPKTLGINVPGTEFVDNAFVSTSLEHATASQWAAGSKAALVRINVPAGQRVLYMEPWVSGESGMHEHEVLLSRGSTFRVKRYVPGTTGRQGRPLTEDPNDIPIRPAYIEVDMVPTEHAG